MSAVLFRSRPGYFQGSAKDTHDHHRHGENRNRLETETRNQRDGPGMVQAWSNRDAMDQENSGSDQHSLVS